MIAAFRCSCIRFPVAFYSSWSIASLDFRRCVPNLEHGEESPIDVGSLPFYFYASIFAAAYILVFLDATVYYS
jgi:hypothetical protein